MDRYFLFRAKKRTVWIVLSILLVLILLAAGSLFYLKNQNSSTLIVFGRINPAVPPADLDPAQVSMGVPVAAVLRELGYTTQQQGANIILISKDDQYLELNLEEHTLYEVGGRKFNYLESPPGGAYWAWSFRDGNDVIVDSTTFASALSLLGSKYRIREIPEHKIVVVYKKWIDLVVV